MEVAAVGIHRQCPRHPRNVSGPQRESTWAQRANCGLTEGRTGTGVETRQTRVHWLLLATPPIKGLDGDWALTHGRSLELTGGLCVGQWNMDLCTCTCFAHSKHFFR
ncbi:hypothetical protein EYF80_059561 [Liparis tanakae]|uniref:Uncharacterized protein n=1 Tax=Liparis tanakae TaxID=230148 RepID=A0A4Z2EMX2_9TELE|nr:hypothetical protein EYF80_059561 [Liparis tanakae]